MASNITLKISSNVDSAVSGINRVNQRLDEMARRNDSLRTRIQSVSLAFGSFAGAVGVAAGAVQGIAGAIGSLVSAYAAQEQAEMRLQSVLNATQGAAGMTSAQMLDLADSLQRVTTYTDQEIIAAEQYLAATRKISDDIMPEATKAVLDMAAATGDDAVGAARDLAQALSDPAGEIDSLKEKGIQLTEAQAENIKAVQEQNGLYEAQKLILQEVEGTYGGIAEAIASTDTGKIQQLKNAWNDLKEGLGEVLTSSIDDLVDYTLGLVERIKSMVDRSVSAHASMERANEILASGDTSLVYSLTDEELAAVAGNGIYSGLHRDIEAGASYSLNAQEQAALAVYEAVLREIDFRSLVAQLNDSSHAGIMWAERELLRQQAASETAAEEAARQAAVEAAQSIIGENGSLSLTSRIREVDEQIAATQTAIDTLESTGGDTQDGAIMVLEEILAALEGQKATLLETASATAVQTATPIEGADQIASFLSANSGLSLSMQLAGLNSDIWTATMMLQDPSATEAQKTALEEVIAALNEEKILLEEMATGSVPSWTDSWEKARDVIGELSDTSSSLVDSIVDLFDTLAENAADRLEEVTASWDSYFEELDSRQDRQIESLNAMLASGAISYEDYIESLKGMDEERAKAEEDRAEAEEEAREKADSLARAAFEAEKANSIAQATINAAMSITDIWASHGGNPVLAGVLTGLSAAATATQIAAIASQQYTPMATGGIVDSPTHALIGEGGSPEMVLPLTKANMDRFGLSADDGGRIQIVVNVGTSYSGEQLAQDVFRGIEMAQRTGALPRWRYA